MSIEAPNEIKLMVALGYVTIDGDCWRWNRGHQSRGYGMAGRKLIHRIAYETFNGPITNGHEVDHTCFIKDCLNPAHLEAVPQSVNRERSAERYRQAMEKRRATMLAKGTCRKGHPYSLENTRIDTRGSRVCKTCANDNARKYRERAA